jgi:hypothetical protein
MTRKADQGKALGPCVRPVCVTGPGPLSVPRACHRPPPGHWLPVALAIPGAQPRSRGSGSLPQRAGGLSVEWPLASALPHPAQTGIPAPGRIGNFKSQTGASPPSRLIPDSRRIGKPPFKFSEKQPGKSGPGESGIRFPSDENSIESTACGGLGNYGVGIYYHWLLSREYHASAPSAPTGSWHAAPSPIQGPREETSHTS